MNRRTTSPRPQSTRGRGARRIAAGAAAVALAFVAAACGGDDKNDTNTPSPGGSSSQNDPNMPAARIVGLWQVKGEDPNAIDDYQNGALIAVDEINAKGGVLGK